MKTVTACACLLLLSGCATGPASKTAANGTAPDLRTEAVPRDDIVDRVTSGVVEAVGPVVLMPLAPYELIKELGL